MSREDVHTDKPGSLRGGILGGHLAEPCKSFLDFIDQIDSLGGPRYGACEKLSEEHGHRLHDVVEDTPPGRDSV